MKWIPCSCGGLFISVAHPLTAFNCGTISPWSDTYWSPHTSGLLARHACPVLPLPLQSPQWHQSGHSECACLFVPSRCFLSMACTPPWPHPLPLPPSLQTPMSPSFSHTTPPALQAGHALLQLAFPCYSLEFLLSILIFYLRFHLYQSLLCEDTLMGMPSHPPLPSASSIQAFSQHLMQNELQWGIIHIHHHCLFAHLSPH